MKRIMIVVALMIGCWSPHADADRLLVEAESFRDPGGWVLDTQFISVMGSPYLLAHGWGQPVEDAITEVTFPNPGLYRVFVRTKDWVARWDAPGQTRPTAIRSPIGVSTRAISTTCSWRAAASA